MKDRLLCPVCLEIFNYFSHQPYVGDCGAICCKNCVQETCVFCGIIHEKRAQELVPFTEALKILIVPCINFDKSAEFIEEKTFNAYCRDCKGNRKGVIMEDDLFKNILDDHLLKFNQLINKDLFKSTHRKILEVKASNEKLELIKVLMQFVNQTGFCHIHQNLAALAIDKDLKFRCGFCDVEDFYFLNDADECKEYLRRRLELSQLKLEEKINWDLFKEAISIVQVVIEVNYLLIMR